MSFLSYGCNSCSTVDDFDGGIQGSFGNGSNQIVNSMIASAQQSNTAPSPPPMNPQPPTTGVATSSQNQYDPRGNPNNFGNNSGNNNSGNNNYNNTAMNSQHGNAQNPMNANMNNVRVPQVVSNAPSNNQPRNNAPPANNGPTPANNGHVVSVGTLSSKDDKKICLVKLVMAIVLSLALHETVKYYINQSIKFNDGSPTYFVYYSLACLVALYVAQQYLPQN